MSDVFESTVDDIDIENSNLSEEDITFVETDADIINADLVSRFESFLGETLAFGDERRMFIQGMAYVLADQLNHINDTGRSNLLRYAKGSELDGLGDLFHNSRLKSQKAVTTLRFTLSQAQGIAVTIPKGTRVTPDSTIFFATDNEITFAANTTELTKDVTATATVEGSAHNGIPTGAIKIIVDTLPYISGVENITESYGGTDVESDDEYRERLRESPFSFSVAGPANAYEAIAKSVTNQIADANAYSPSAGCVEIAILLQDGVIPDEDSDADIFDAVTAACSAKSARPLTDNVSVVPATAVPIAIDVTYYVANNNISVASDVLQAVEDYKAWQCEKIGRDINPEKLRELMRNAGAAMINVASPIYTKVSEGAVAQITTTSVTCGGSITE